MRNKCPVPHIFLFSIVFRPVLRPISSVIPVQAVEALRDARG
jgi:hypothetical protein